MGYKEMTKNVNENPSVQEIVLKYLEENEYGGLYSDIDECGCSLKQLFACGEAPDCKAGYLGKECPSDYDYVIVSGKQG